MHLARKFLAIISTLASLFFLFLAIVSIYRPLHVHLYSRNHKLPVHLSDHPPRGIRDLLEPSDSPFEDDNHFTDSQMCDPEYDAGIFGEILYIRRNKYLRTDDPEYESVNMADFDRVVHPGIFLSKAGWMDTWRSGSTSRIFLCPLWLMAMIFAMVPLWSLWRKFRFRDRIASRFPVQAESSPTALRDLMK